MEAHQCAFNVDVNIFSFIRLFPRPSLPPTILLHPLCHLSFHSKHSYLLVSVCSSTHSISHYNFSSFLHVSSKCYLSDFIPASTVKEFPNFIHKQQ